MIEKFVKRWEARKHLLREQFAETAPTAEQIRRYMTLALHIVQGLREMGRTDA